MIKIAIVEDEAMYAKQLEEFLHQYEAENHEALAYIIADTKINLIQPGDK